MKSKDHIHRRRLDRVHEEHRRRRAAARRRWPARDDRADGHQPAAARRERDRRQQADRDARRHGDGRDLFRPARGARRRRLRRRRFQIGGYEPCDRHRFRDAQEVRPAPDHRRHARRRRHHARPPHRAASVDDLRGHAAQSAREAIMLQYVNPMAINTWAIAEKYPDDQAGRPLPLGAGHGDGARPRSRHSRTRKSATARPASTTWRST